MYGALDVSLGRRVVVKVRHLPQQAKRARARFLREARAAGAVQHPNIVNIFDFGAEGDLVFLVMELVEGRTLAQLLKQEGRLDHRRALSILMPIFSAVARLHAHGVIHRDIKPSNILLRSGDESRPSLSDFGLSRFVEEFSDVTGTGETLGTPEYMAPEMTRSARAATEQSDQFALGVTLYECLTGERPFRGATPYQSVRAVLTRSLPVPSAFNAELPEDLDSSVMRALHRSPQERFDSVDAMAEALSGFGNYDPEWPTAAR